jgi:4-hydroxybenzoate polyprenyltransferase
VLNRWWIYQHERFPVLNHGLLIAAFSLSAVTFSSLLRGRAAGVEW